MFYARVMVGNTIVLNPNKDLRMPPPVNAANPNDLYDSVQGFTGNSDVFMIYTNTQAYPEYLITYK
jgi:poly [ADP-ribose] polymerase 10/14/15